jgi:arabinose-5-phosphate isomerase
VAEAAGARTQLTGVVGALAVALLLERGFQEEDFALFHPGGALGKRLLLRVEDLMHKGGDIPLVQADTPLKEALFEITSKKLGITGVSDDLGHLLGFLPMATCAAASSRASMPQPSDHRVHDLQPQTHPAVQSGGQGAAADGRARHHVLFVFESEESRAPVGIIHLHDLLRRSGLMRSACAVSVCCCSTSTGS